MWLLYTLPLGANRSNEEVRARTLVGALESIRCGITCVQDMLGLIPLDDAYTDVVIVVYLDRVSVGFRPCLGSFASAWCATSTTCQRTCRRCWASPAARCATNSTISNTSSAAIPPKARCTGRSPVAPQVQPPLLQVRASLQRSTTIRLHPCLRDPWPGADRARAVFRSRRLVYLLSRQQRPARSAGSTSSTASGSRAPRWTAWPPPMLASCSIIVQYEAQERDRAGLRPARGRRTDRARLRQLQRLGRAERVPGDEDVLPSRRR